MKTGSLLRGIVIAAAALCPGAMHGADTDTSSSRPVTGIYSLETGGRHDVATYLSPLHYHGVIYYASGFWSKALPFAPERCVMSFEGRLGGANMLNPAGTAAMIDVEGLFRYGMGWRTRLPYGITVGAGGYAGLEGGAMWLMRNSNNPVQLRLWAGIGAQGYISYVFRIGRLPVLAADRVCMPLAGCFFCQEYGETLYEVYLGNRKGLAHFGWPGNRVGVENHMSLTLDFGKTAMSIGYRYAFQNEEANSLVTRTSTHTFTIGVIPGGIGLKRKSKQPEINSLYL